MLKFVPELEQQFTRFAEDTLQAGIISDREVVLAILATAFTLEDAEMVKQGIVEAKQVGVTNEEIGQISAIVIALRAKKIAGLGLVSASSTQSKASISTSKCCE